MLLTVRKLAHPDDIKKDMYESGFTKDHILMSSFVHTTMTASTLKRLPLTYKPPILCWVLKPPSVASGNNVYYLRHLHSVHPSNDAFRRVLALLFVSGICVYMLLKMSHEHSVSSVSHVHV